MKRILLLFCTVMFLLNSAVCQVPQKFNYQAVVRNIEGKVISNSEISVRISILQDGNFLVYEEEFETTTNAFGLINLKIGEKEDDAFSSVDWSQGKYSLKIDIDETGGVNYSYVGTSPLLSVPFALSAKTAENVFSGDYNDLKNVPSFILDGDNDTHLTDDEIAALGYVKSSVDSDSDSSNEIQDLVLNKLTHVLKINKNNSSTEIDLSKYLVDTDTKLSDADITALGYIKDADDSDSDSSNEIQDLALNQTTHILTITKNGSSTEIDLSPYLDNTDTKLSDSDIAALGYIKIADDADANPSNEIQDLSLNELTNVLTITKNGSASEINLNKFLDNTDTKLSDSDIAALGYIKDADDGDANASNEIQDLALNSTTNILTISNNGLATEIDLTPYLNVDTKLSDSDITALGYIKNSDDGDANSSNEIQDLSLNSTTNVLTITNNDSAAEIDLSPYLDDTDTKLSDSDIAALGYIKNADDGDFDASNEIQDLSLNETTNVLTITNNGSATKVDLTPYLNVDTKISDAEITSLGYKKNVDDADADSSNEIQVLSVSNDTVYLENGGYVRLPTKGFYYTECKGENNIYELSQKSITDIYEGLSISFKANHTNSGNVFLKINDKESVELKKNVSESVVSGDIIENQIIHVTYDGGYFQTTIGSLSITGSNPQKVEHGIITYDEPGRYEFIVPVGVSQVYLKLYGGVGGDGQSAYNTNYYLIAYGGGGGRGTYVNALVNVSSGEKLIIFVGKHGESRGNVYGTSSTIYSKGSGLDGTDGEESYFKRESDGEKIISATGGTFGTGYQVEPGGITKGKDGKGGEVVVKEGAGVFFLSISEIVTSVNPTVIQW